VRRSTPPVTSDAGATIKIVFVSAATAATGQLEELLALNEGLVGASTGFLVETRGDWPTSVASCADLSTDVIELSALSWHELSALERYLLAPDDLNRFDSVSVHGPAKGCNSNPAALVDRLVRLPDLVDGVVMHPDRLQDLGVFAVLGERLWLENMDTRKQDARTVDELQHFFDLLPHAQFCFDIAHAWLHDPAMTLAHALLDAFGDRLAEVHLSSILPSGEHVPLQPRVMSSYTPVVARCVGVPWILEAPLPG
jgi:hypothetical protein